MVILFNNTALGMKKKMEQIEVEVVNDAIHIIQSDPVRDEPEVVIVSADQVPLLIQWLKDAAATINGEGGNGRSHSE
jgi:hypothetical protein